MNKNKEPNKKYEDGGKEEEQENMTNEPSLLGDINFPGCKGGKKGEEVTKSKTRWKRRKHVEGIGGSPWVCNEKPFFLCCACTHTVYPPRKAGKWENILRPDRKRGKKKEGEKMNFNPIHESSSLDRALGWERGGGEERGRGLFCQKLALGDKGRRRREDFSFPSPVFP